MSDTRSRRLLVAGAAAAALLLLPSQARADKLVIFKNGKVMRAKSVQTGKNWTTLSLGKDNAMGVPNTQIAAIEEAESTSVNRAASLPNQASVGGRGGGGGRGGRPTAFTPQTPRGGSSVQHDDGEEADDSAEAVEAEEAQPQDGPLQRNVGGRRRPGVSGVRSLQENLNQINQQSGARRGGSFNRRLRGTQAGGSTGDK